MVGKGWKRVGKGREKREKVRRVGKVEKSGKRREKGRKVSDNC